MPMNILLLEDRGSISKALTPLLTHKGFTVFEAFNPADANGIMNHEKGADIKSIILDLNLPVDGLTSEQVTNTNDGLFSGWVWLKYHVLNKDMGMLERTILYSAYISTLFNHVDEEEKKLLNKIKKVRKREGTGSPGSEILKYLRIIEGLK